MVVDESLSHIARRRPAGRRDLQPAECTLACAAGDRLDRSSWHSGGRADPAARQKRMAQGTRGSVLAASSPTTYVRFASKRAEANGEVCGGAIGGRATSAGLTLSLIRGSSEYLARKAEAPRSDPTTLSGGRKRVPLIGLHGD